ncbi:MAG TPA: efflux transporter outer membrane subunit [Steroidobacteraceae bacterium]|nr:efflux transporter outer membrane subunit [Gammaproteobacteria bacterium]HEV2284515.1 efflux transporter outer membrane subunit [Steroidobacteraceae bacterium]
MHAWPSFPGSLRRPWRTRTRALGVSSLAAATVALAACSLGPRYHKPDIAPPGNWVTAADAAAPEWPSSEWWRGFNSPDLDAFIAEAQRANDDLRAAVARVSEAEAERRIARAPLLPSLGVAAQATRARAPQAGPGAAYATGNDFNPLLTASYQLDFFGKSRAQLAAATATANASRYDRATVELTVMAGVASSYFQALELRDRLAIADSNLANASQALHGLELEERAGIATALDVAQQQTVVATVNASIPPLREQLRQTLDALAILVGSPPQAVEVTSGGLDALSQPRVRPGLPSELLARRPDVAAAEAQLIAANANIAAARAAFFPAINLTADGGYESPALATLLSPASRVWSLGAGLTQPIFQGGALTGGYALARAQYQELLAGYHKAVIAALANVEDALIAAQQTAEQVSRQQQATAQARRAYRFAQAQMHAGTINVLTLLNTETTLFTAEDALAQAKYAHLQSLVSLYQALGGGWQQQDERL